MASTTTTSKNVYLAGDWLEPPKQLAETLKRNGHRIVTEWWDDRVAHVSNIKLLMQCIEKCDIYVLDLRSSRFGRHPFAGSHIGLGLALGMCKQVAVLVPPEALMPLTSLVNPFCFRDEAVMILGSGLAPSGDNPVAASLPPVTDH